MRFKNDIYRLRRAIGSKVVVFDGDLYTFNRTLDYDYDVEIFENYLERAKKTSDQNERITYYQAAVDLVDGAYLSDISAEWVWMDRERLNRLYISSLLTLSKLYFDRNRLNAAQKICLKALRYDSCLEGVHRLLMEIYFLQGDRAAIVRQYQICENALKQELDLPVSEETEKLYWQLIQ